MKMQSDWTDVFFASFLFMLSSHGLAQEKGSNWIEGTTPSGEDVRVPIVSAKPLKYPRRAERLGAEGYVSVAFDVDEAGEVVDLRIIDSKPRILFDKAALTYVKKMRLDPATLEGAPVYASVTLTLKFAIND